MNYDFEGWASKNDLKCTDGKIIRRDAFKVNDGRKVPLIYQHNHDEIGAVLGHALLENRDEGVYAYCKFNNTAAGNEGREIVKHGDVESLSIWANNVEQIGNEVIHGVIREVSLVLAGANPGAYIESVVDHGQPMEDGDDEGIFYSGCSIIISHADIDDKDDKDKKGDQNKNEKSSKTVKDVIDAMTDEQKAAVGILVEQASKGSKKEDGISSNDEGDEDDKDDKDEKSKKEKEEKEMKHNLFEGKSSAGQVLSHSDMEKIFADAKKMGSLRDAINVNIENGVLSHAVPTEGMVTSEGTQTYGFNDPSMLFPDYKAINTTPEWISRKMDWVAKLMSKVHRTPFSRIKSLYANITEDEARAKGYIKGKQKKEEVFTTLKRTTDPQTIYKKQKLDRDDIIDITDFDIVAWIKAEMRVMLDEELARAILIGDGRPSDSDDKIQEGHVRPMAKDVPLYNTIIKVTVPSDATEDVIAKETIKAAIRGRKQYKGSGRPDFWTTEDVMTEMLLLEDAIGHPLYKTETELATKLRVSEIIPVEPMEGQKITVDSVEYPLIGIIVNAADYNIGADKGGEVNMFEDFDIDFNQQKYLIETRISGAPIKPFSILTLVLDKAGAAG